MRSIEDSLPEPLPLTLFWSPGSCSFAPHVVLEELGVPYRAEVILSRDGRMTNTPEWRLVNPKGRVPALHPVPGWSGGRHDLLTEVPAILVYLAQRFGTPTLLPSDPAGLARCLEWMNWLSGTVHAQGYGGIWRPERFSDDARTHNSIAAKGRETVLASYALIERILSDGRVWSAGRDYTVVDPYLTVFHRWGVRIGLDMRGYPAWSRLAAEVLSRPAARRVLEAEADAEPG